MHGTVHTSTYEVLFSEWLSNLVTTRSGSLADLWWLVTTAARFDGYRDPHCTRVLPACYEHRCALLNYSGGISSHHAHEAVGDFAGQPLRTLRLAQHGAKGVPRGQTTLVFEPGHVRESHGQQLRAGLESIFLGVGQADFGKGARELVSGTNARAENRDSLAQEHAQEVEARENGVFRLDPLALGAGVSASRVPLPLAQHLHHEHEVELEVVPPAIEQASSRGNARDSSGVPDEKKSAKQISARTVNKNTAALTSSDDNGT